MRPSRRGSAIGKIHLLESEEFSNDNTDHQR